VLAGERYQSLSVRSGGLRFPVCEVLQYGAAFEAIGQHIGAALGLQCAVTPPPLPTGQSYGAVAVEYSPTGGAVEQFTLATDPTTCSATGFLRDATTNRVTLCPGACARLGSDPTATVAVNYTCLSGKGP
jgi:hypothetical protein